jgi:hypothetical protein
VCTLTLLQAHWLMSIEQDRYVCILTLLQSHWLMSIEQDRYVCTLTLIQSQFLNVYRTEPEFVFLNTALVTLVNV